MPLFLPAATLFTDAVAPCGQVDVVVQSEAFGWRALEVDGQRVAEGYGDLSWSGNPWAEGEAWGQARVVGRTGRVIAAARLRPEVPAELAVSWGPLRREDRPISLRAEVTSDCAMSGFALEGVFSGPRTREADPQWSARTLPAEGELLFPEDGTWTGEWSLTWHGFPTLSLQQTVHVGPPCKDFDGDGLTDCDGDCVDRDLLVRPGLPEVPNDGRDNDCDGFLAGDGDGDGRDGVLRPKRLSDAQRALLLERMDAEAAAAWEAKALTEPRPWSNRYGDCDDGCRGWANDSFANMDGDRDGYSPLAGDCDDNKRERHPKAPELPNCRDDDCDGSIDEGAPPLEDPFEPDDDLAHARWLGPLDRRMKAVPVYLGPGDVDWVAILVPPQETNAEVDVRAQVGGGRPYVMSVFEGPVWTDPSGPPPPPEALRLRGSDAREGGGARVWVGQSVRFGPEEEAWTPKVAGFVRDNPTLGTMFFAYYGTLIAVGHDFKLASDRIADREGPQELEPYPTEPRVFYIRFEAMEEGGQTCPGHVDIFGGALPDLEFME